MPVGRSEFTIRLRGIAYFRHTVIWHVGDPSGVGLLCTDSQSLERLTIGHVPHILAPFLRWIKLTC